jgi:hypothetical protein
VETPIRELQTLDDLAGDAAGRQVIHLLAVAGPRHEAPDDEFDVEMQRLLVERGLASEAFLERPKCGASHSVIVRPAKTPALSRYARRHACSCNPHTGLRLAPP